MWVDCHTHLNFEAFANDWKEVVERAVAAGVKKMIVVGTDVESSKRAVEMAGENEHLWASVGIHPHHARSIKSIKSIKGIKELAKQPRVVAVGEIGLDYHVYKATKYKIQEIDKKLQKELFEVQLQVAQELDKPVIIHSREAGEEVLELARGVRGVFHCFDGSKKYLRKILAMGWYVSFTGNITYVPDRAEVAKEVALERLVVETDCPYMVPQPKKGQGVTRSRPEDVIIIGQFHADQRTVQLAEVAQITTANAERLFKL